MARFFLLFGSITFLTIAGAGVMDGACLALAALLVGARLRLSARSSPPSRLACAAAVLLGIIVLTCIPLPSAMNSVLGQRGVQNECVRQAAIEARTLNITRAAPGWSALTRNRAGSLRLLLVLLTAFVAGSLSTTLAPRWKKRLVISLVMLGAIVGLAGIASRLWFPQHKTIWWLIRVPHGRPLACFINRNHFGSYMAMLLPCALVLAADALPRRRWAEGIGCSLAALLLLLALTASHSRGAWIAGAIAVIGVCLAAANRRTIMTLLILLLGAGAMTWAAMQLPEGRAIAERAETLESGFETQTGQMRVSTWMDTLSILRDYPLLGAGANGFRMTFPLHRTASTRQSFKHAENEFLQSIAELGILGASALIVFLGLLFVASHGGERRDPDCRILQLCATGATIAVIVHATGDFALRVPLYLTTFACLVGIGMTPHTPLSTTCRLQIRWFWCAALVVTIGIGLSGKRIYERDDPDFIASAHADDACHMLRWAPTSWQAWYQLGRHAIRAASPEAMRFGERCLTRATTLDANNYLLWERVALVRFHLNDINGGHKALAALEGLRPWKANALRHTLKQRGFLLPQRGHTE